MNALTTALGQLPAAGAYAIVAVAVLAESVLLIGVFIPTLTLLLTAGALARTGTLHLPLLITTAAGAVVVGDFLAHRTGRALGARLRTGCLGRCLPIAAWQRAEAQMARRGGHAVFLARFLPVIRTVTPHLAGASRLPYHRIAPYSLAAALLWATAEAGAGYTAAASLQHALTFGGPVLAMSAGAATGTVLLWSALRRNRTAASSVARRSALRNSGATKGAGRSARATATAGRAAVRPVRPVGRTPGSDGAACLVDF
ncbi:DedA family protein [Streptomyces sp. NRRL F-5755]|uniref:DedA family protein n=1 Tax=Streptomyces sp. NRRL F-5755 TaxID=1519475 RepID=UPI0007C71603|nr:VTT domain-containing protein [Streptomyces sp. NRRL F-5755]